MQLRYIAPRYLFRRHTILRNIPKNDGTFLEIGAGNLELSSELVAKFEQGTAIDFQPRTLDLYKKIPPHIAKKINIIIGDFMTYEFKNKFNYIVACEVMEHVKDDAAFVGRIRQLLANDGSLLLSVPAKQKYWTAHDEAVGHYRRYEKSDLVKFLQSHGFKSVRIYSYGFPFINILWFLRWIHGYFQLKRKRDLSQEQRTKESGARQTESLNKYLGFITNKFIFFLPNLFTTLFDRFNLSEGYVIICRK